jgi:hypothetical protein
MGGSRRSPAIAMPDNAWECGSSVGAVVSVCDQADRDAARAVASEMERLPDVDDWCWCGLVRGQSGSGKLPYVSIVR